MGVGGGYTGMEHLGSRRTLRAFRRTLRAFGCDHLGAERHHRLCLFGGHVQVVTSTRDERWHKNADVTVAVLGDAAQRRLPRQNDGEGRLRDL